MSKRDIKHLSKPWITPAIRKSIIIKNKLYKKFIRNKSLYYHNKFKHYRTKLNHLIKISKVDYNSNYFNNNRTNIKNMWRGIKNIISLKPLNTSLPSKILINNTEFTDCKSIANAFNDFFSNIGRNLASSIPSGNASAMTFMPPAQEECTYLSPTTSEEIEEEISKLNSTKATGPFSVPTKILKMIKGIISTPLEIIFNLSLSKGIVPDCFKLARVIPMSKNGSQMSLNNYRPISLLSVFSRILEKLMFKRLMNFIVSMNGYVLINSH